MTSTPRLTPSPTLTGACRPRWRGAWALGLLLLPLALAAPLTAQDEPPPLAPTAHLMSLQRLAVSGETRTAGNVTMSFEIERIIIDGYRVVFGDRDDLYEFAPDPNPPRFSPLPTVEPERPASSVTIRRVWREVTPFRGNTLRFYIWVWGGSVPCSYGSGSYPAVPLFLSADGTEFAHAYPEEVHVSQTAFRGNRLYLFGFEVDEGREPPPPARKVCGPPPVPPFWYDPPVILWTDNGREWQRLPTPIPEEVSLFRTFWWRDALHHAADDGDIERVSDDGMITLLGTLPYHLKQVSHIAAQENQLFAAFDHRSGEPRHAIYTSNDGSEWQEALPLPDVERMEIWTGPVSVPVAEGALFAYAGFALYSPDGDHWFRFDLEGLTAAAATDETLYLGTDDQLLATPIPRLLWHDASTLGSGWQWSPWYGFFATPEDTDWVWHPVYGWQWIDPVQLETGFWVYDTDLGWLLLARYFFPRVWRAETAAWITLPAPFGGE